MQTSHNLSTKALSDGINYKIITVSLTTIPNAVQPFHVSLKDSKIIQSFQAQFAHQDSPNHSEQYPIIRSTV